MSMAVNPVRLTPPAASPGRAATPARAEGFGGLLTETIQKVEGFRQTANEATEQFLKGESVDLHNVALAVQRAELALDLFVQVRNKVTQAYQEVMRMQI